MKTHVLAALWLAGALSCSPAPPAPLQALALTRAPGRRPLYAPPRARRRRSKMLAIYRHLWHDLLHEPERELVFDTIRRWLDARARPAPEGPQSAPLRPRSPPPRPW